MVNPPREGGGQFPPFKESFLEQIVNVSWTKFGGVFVSGDFCCFERTVTIADPNTQQDWQPLGSLAFGPGGGCFASTYAVAKGVPTFVIGGHGDHYGIEHGPVIMWSHDGTKWTDVGAALQMNASDIVTGGLVWDADLKRFYVKTIQELSTSVRDTFYSPDGEYWFFSEDEFSAHCKGPLSGVGDVMEGIGDGIYGYDAAHDLAIYPSRNESGNFTGGSYARYPVSKARIGGDDDFQIDVGLEECFCVTYMQGIWMAAGNGKNKDGETGSATTSSYDNGNTWTLVTWGGSGQVGEPMPAGYDVETIIGGPIQDFK